MAVSKEDIVDIVASCLKCAVPRESSAKKMIEQKNSRQGKWGFYLRETYNKSFTSLPTKRLFYSEYDIKRILKESKNKLQVPKSAIISPLAEEWLKEKRIEIIYE